MKELTKRDIDLLLTLVAGDIDTFIGPIKEMLSD